MYIVDSQFHLWAAETPDRPWPKGLNKPHRPAPFLPDDLLREMDAAGVNRAVLVPPTWDGRRNDLALCEWLAGRCLRVEASPGVKNQRVAVTGAVECPASRLGMNTMRQLATTIVPARK